MVEKVQNNKEFEVINEKLQEAISITILLENDMMIQNSDGVGANAVKVIHNILKSIQVDLQNLK